MEFNDLVTFHLGFARDIFSTFEKKEMNMGLREERIFEEDEQELETIWGEAEDTEYGDDWQEA